MTIRNPLRTLRARLLVAVGVVVVTAVTVIGLVSGRITTVEFHRFRESFVGENEPPPLPDGIARQLTDHYVRTGTWRGADRLLAAIGGGQRPPRDFVLFDADDRFAAASSGKLWDAEITPLPEGGFHLSAGGPHDGGEGRIELIFGGRSLPLSDPSGRTIGTLYAMPALPGDDLSPADRFLLAVRRWQLAAVAGAGLAALLVTFLLTRRIVAPIEALTGAARRMEQGDLAQRVPVGVDDEIGQLASAFNAMADGLQRTERLRRQMVTDVAHELRTPLTGLRCQLESIEDGVVQASPAIVASLLDDILSLQQVVDDLQDLALVEAGQVRLQRSPIDPATEIEAVIGSLPPAAGRRVDGTGGAKIHTTLEGLPPLDADRHRFRQIVRNLLVNALTQTPAGGSIEVAGRALDRTVEITVRDEGPGIPPEHLPHIFERFYRADPSRQRSTGGAGLGLAIVKSLVEAHGGEIRAASEPGRGATFTLAFPRAG